MQLTSGIASAFFNLIETFEGGRVAALAGRFMANIKNETISYLLMAVKDNRLCYMNDQGILVDLVKMPETKMGISAGKEVMYLFGQNNNGKDYGLYALAKGGKYKQLLVSPRPVVTAVEMNDSLYLAIGSGVFSFSPQGNKLNLVAGLQKDNEIKSMTVDPTDNILYIATHQLYFK